MHFIYRPQKLRLILVFIVISVFLRSFIAPGYMLKTTAEDGLGIIFCDGPVTLYVSQDNHTAHTHHDGDNNSDVQNEIHISPICSHWSTSSMLVFNTNIGPIRFDLKYSAFNNNYITPIYREYSDNTYTIRGPPVYI